jgi:uncharacterized protein YdhG (YjbR/CyaY superfamily)
MSSPDLVTDPRAVEFRQLNSTKHGMMASIGDPEQHDGNVRSAITNAHNAANEALAKVAKLPKDETRTDAAKHYVASQIAAKAEAVILQSQAFIEQTAKTLEAEAVEDMNAGFATDPNRSAIHTEIRAWIREKAREPKGLVEIRKAMMGDFEVAAVISHSQPFLLGLADEVRTSMFEDAVKRYKPEASAKLDKAVELKALAKKYTVFARSLKASSFNPQIAAKWHNRIEP